MQSVGYGVSLAASKLQQLESFAPLGAQLGVLSNNMQSRVYTAFDKS